jgi:hypothetical protein
MAPHDHLSREDRTSASSLEAEDPTEWRKTEAEASDHLRVKNLIEAIGGIIRRLQEKIELAITLRR